MIGMPKQAPVRQDKRATWDNSPELRESVRDDLYEWGGAQRGGVVRLGYPSRQPFATKTGKMPPTYNPDKVDAITDTFVMWNLIQRECGEPDTRRELGKLQRVLKLYFIRQGPVEAMSERMKVSRQTFYKLLGEAMYRFWVLHY